VLYDNIYVASLLSDLPKTFEIARELAKRGGDEEKRFFLQQMPARHSEDNLQVVRSSDGNETPQLDPLSDEDVDLMLDIYTELKSKSSDVEDTAAASGGQIAYASNGQAYLNVGGQWIPLGYRSFGNYQTQLVINELRQAGRKELADQMFEEQLAEAKKASQLAGVIGLLIDQDDFERAEEFYKKWLEQVREELAKDPPMASGTGARGQPPTPVAAALDTLCRWIGHLGAQEEYDRVRDIGDELLDLAQAEHRWLLQWQAKSRSRASRSRSPQSSMGQMSTQVYFGDKQEYERVQYIAPAQLVSGNAAQLLFQLKRVYREGGLLDELADYLKNASTKPIPPNARKSRAC
jgi:tetratricopeptide (TPR) repeat protein